jgi:glyceraldehyde 3-phosphate dehydrogenase/glyceraldehyde-3-phosphate dehydrogenase (NAD(P))
MKRFAINGAGRIGRLVIREYLRRMKTCSWSRSMT